MYTSDIQYTFQIEIIKKILIISLALHDDSRQNCANLFRKIDNVPNLISQKVIRRPLSYMWFTAPGCRIKNKEIVVHLLVDFHYASFITTPIAIVWSRKDSYYLLLMTPIEAVHDQLVCPCNHCKTIRMIKVL